MEPSPLFFATGPSCRLGERVLWRDVNLALPRQLAARAHPQLLALLRALQLDPDVLLLDEPCASLDHATGLAVEDLLGDWLAAGERACLLTSHDPGQIERFTSARLELRP